MVLLDTDRGYEGGIVHVDYLGVCLRMGGRSTLLNGDDDGYLVLGG